MTVVPTPSLNFSFLWTERHSILEAGSLIPEREQLTSLRKFLIQTRFTKSLLFQDFIAGTTPGERRLYPFEMPVNPAHPELQDCSSLGILPQSVVDCHWCCCLWVIPVNNSSLILQWITPVSSLVHQIAVGGIVSLVCCWCLSGGRVVNRCLFNLPRKSHTINHPPFAIFSGPSVLAG